MSPVAKLLWPLLLLIIIIIITIIIITEMTVRIHPNLMCLVRGCCGCNCACFCAVSMLRIFLCSDELVQGLELSVCILACDCYLGNVRI